MNRETAHLEYPEAINAYFVDVVHKAKDLFVDGVKVDARAFLANHYKFDKRIFHLSNRLVIPPEVVAGGLDELIARPLSKDTLTVRIGMRDPVDVDPKDYNWRKNVETTISHDKEGGTIVYHTIALPKVVYDLYYSGLVNGFIWPVNHQRPEIAQDPYRLFNVAGQEVFGREQKAYAEAKFDAQVGAARTANQFAAEAILELINPRLDDTGFVHDPHFCETGKYLRETGAKFALAYFLHTPATAENIYRSNLTKQQQEYIRESYQALYAYNLIAVQDKRDFNNVFKLVGDHEPPEKPGLYQSHEMTREDDNGCTKRTSIGVFPVVGHNELYAMQADAVKNFWKARWLLGSHGFKLTAEGPKKLDILTWGRLDYSKGLVNMLRAVDYALDVLGVNVDGGLKFLMQAAYGRKDVVAFQQEKINVETAHADLKSRFAPDKLSVGLHLERVSRPILLALARMTRIGLITPLIDGFNLTATEYLAAQDPKDPGVLILGKNAGAATIIGNGAIQVDAAAPREIARAIKKALSMTLEERKAMYQRAMARVTRYSNADWLDSLKKCTQAAYAQQQEEPAREAVSRPAQAPSAPVA